MRFASLSPMPSRPRLPTPPDIAFGEDGAMRATAYGDVYFSLDGGLEETRAVFLQGSDLPNAWRNRADYSIGELGFGSGLNALATWALWRRERPSAEARLHFVSIEAHPLPAAAAARALAPFPELAPLAAALVARWPPRAYGPHVLAFPEDGFRLTVLVGEAPNVLAGLVGRFDAFFLDGFAPSRNPEMWRPDLLAAVVGACRPGARLATYSVAAPVRAALTAAGACVAKRPGFGRKRERLEAIVTAPAALAPALLRIDVGRARPASALVIGGGVAGAACAWALGAHAVPVTLIEPDPELTHAASGAPGGLVLPRLDRDDSPLARLHRAAFLRAAALYREAPPGVFDATAVLEPWLEHGTELERLLADPPLPPDWLERTPDGALHRMGGLLRPRAAIDWLAAEATRRTGAVARVERCADGWAALDASGRELGRAGACILCAGADLARFPQTAHLPLRRARGQLEFGPTPGAEAPARSGDGYAAPLGGGLAVFGATFDRLDEDAPCPAPDDASRARNLAMLARLAPGWRPDPAGLESRVAVRATLPDRIPVAGLAPDAEAFRARFAGLAFGRQPPLDAPAPAHEGLYVLGGLGARGYTLAPLLAERIAAELCGAPQALDRAELEACHPARFLVRALKRRA